MCNLYNITTTQRAMIEWTRAMRDLAGNLELSSDIYPDYPAPVVRNGLDGERELARMRWGMPSSSQAIYQATAKRADKLRAKGKPVDFDALLKMEPDGGTTNIRNTSSKHWARWLGVENRAVVPFTSFAEPDPASKPEGGPTPNAWFAIDESCPLVRRLLGSPVGKRAEGQGKAYKERPLCLPDHRTQWGRWANPSKGNAGHPHRQG